MPKSSARKSPFSSNCRRFSAGPRRTSIVKPFKKRKVSFDVNDKFDVTSRFLTSPHASGANPASSSRQKDTRSSAKTTCTKRSTSELPKRSLSRLSRSGCLRLLDAGGFSTTETCENQSPLMSRAVPSVSEDDMSLPSCSDSQVGMDMESPPPLRSPDNPSTCISLCWGHFIDFHLPDLEEQRRSHNQRNSARSSSTWRTKNSRFSPYSKDKYSYSKPLPSIYNNTTSLATTDDISTAMNKISLRQL